MLRGEQSYWWCTGIRNLRSTRHRRGRCNRTGTCSLCSNRFHIVLYSSLMKRADISEILSFLHSINTRCDSNTLVNPQKSQPFYSHCPVLRVRVQTRKTAAKVTVEDIICQIWNKSRAQRALVLASGATEAEQTSYPPCLGVCEMLLREPGCFYKAERWADSMEAVGSGHINRRDLTSLRGRIDRSGQTSGLDEAVSHKQLEAHQRTSVPEGASGFTHLSRVG